MTSRATIKSTEEMRMNADKTLNDARNVAQACLDLIDAHPSWTVDEIKTLVDKVWNPGMTAREIVAAATIAA